MVTKRNLIPSKEVSITPQKDRDEPRDKTATFWFDWVMFGEPLSVFSIDTVGYLPHSPKGELKMKKRVHIGRVIAWITTLSVMLYFATVADWNPFAAVVIFSIIGYLWAE